MEKLAYIGRVAKPEGVMKTVDNSRGAISIPPGGVDSHQGSCSSRQCCQRRFSLEVSELSIQYLGISTSSKTMHVFPMSD